MNDRLKASGLRASSRSASRRRASRRSRWRVKAVTPTLDDAWRRSTTFDDYRSTPHAQELNASRSTDATTRRAGEAGGETALPIGVDKCAELDALHGSDGVVEMSVQRAGASEFCVLTLRSGGNTSD